jgi:hypothetical protein
MTLSVSMLIIGIGAATPSRTVNLSIGRTTFKRAGRPRGKRLSRSVGE